MTVTVKNIKTANQLADLRALLRLEGSKSIAVAYVDMNGLKLIQEQLEDALKDGQQSRLFIDLQSGNTEPAAVHELVSLSEKHPGLKIKAFHPAHRQPRLHAKLFIAHSEGKGPVTFLTGSYNLTEAALKRNREHGLLVECDGQEEIGHQTLKEFEHIWRDENTITVNKKAAEYYERGYRKGGDIQDVQQDRSLWKGYRDQEFSWPSEEAAFLMGAICARGKIIQPSSSRKIEISLRFQPKNYSEGQIKVRGRGPDAAEALSQIPVLLKEEIARTLPLAKVSDNGRQKLFVDCYGEKQAFDTILQAFGAKVTNEPLSLPRHLIRSNKAIVRGFLRGYSVCSALITDNTRMPGKGDSRPYAVWLRPPNDKLFQPLQGLIQGKLRIDAELPPNDKLFQPLQGLIQGKLGIDAELPRYQRSPRTPYCIRILAEDFSKEIEFGIEWWDNLVSRAADYNRQLAS